MTSTTPKPTNDSVNLLGMRIDRIDMDEALARIDRFIQEKTPHQIVTADASMVVTAAQDPDFARIVAASDLVTPDGWGILWATKRLGIPVRTKVSGVDLSACCIEQSVQTGWRIFFFGSAPGVAAEAKAQMEKRYPGANIVGCRDGYFKPEEEDAVVAGKRAARPDILLVALGIPKQEKFIDRHKAALGIPVCIGVGGTLDVFSGSVKRAPVWMQNAGLEWLYRTASDPKRRIKKLSQLPTFVRMTLSAPR